MKLAEVGSAAVANAIMFLVFKPPAAKLGSFTIRLPPILAGAHYCQIHSGLASTAKLKKKRIKKGNEINSWLRKHRLGQSNHSSSLGVLNCPQKLLSRSSV